MKTVQITQFEFDSIKNVHIPEPTYKLVYPYLEQANVILRARHIAGLATEITFREGPVYEIHYEPYV